MSMKDAFNEFLEAKGDRPFMGGDSPNLGNFISILTVHCAWYFTYIIHVSTYIIFFLADLAFYGAINSFSGCAGFNLILN